ncbi:MAG: hypothetical protein Q9219_002547 [cf. Caloplaca sp. 3 TL-2023]
MSLWSFKPDGSGSGTWKEEIGKDDPAFNRLMRPFKGYIGYGGDSAFVFGGISNFQSDERTKDVTDDILLPGLIKLNMTTKEFTNSSAEDFGRDGDAVFGGMHYVPSFGPGGLFLLMGGSGVPEGSDNLIDMTNIRVYDPASSKWYNQTATGNVPEDRKEFCIAGVNSTSETYEIFVYGGDNGNLGPDAVAYDEIFILSLPAFRWFKVDYPPAHPRNGHTCNAVGGSQIISIGGVDSNSRVHYGDYYSIGQSTFNSSIDPFKQGLGIFDMTTLTWASKYTANAPPYEQSDLVRNFYTQNPQDGSQFTTPEVANLFQITHFAQTPPAATNPDPTPDSDSDDDSSSNTGAIAGGVVGGVAGLAGIAGIAFFLLRRRRQHGQYDQTTGFSGASQHQGNGVPLHEMSAGQGEYYGGEENKYKDVPPQRPLAEMEEARPEMGHDEMGGTVRRPLEMEAREVGLGR